MKIPTASENINRISENTHRIYLKMAKCRLTRLAWSGLCLCCNMDARLNAGGYDSVGVTLWYHTIAYERKV